MSEENNPTPEVEAEVTEAEAQEEQVTETEPPVRKSSDDYARQRIAKSEEKKAMAEVEKLRQEIEQMKQAPNAREIDNDVVRDLATKQEVSDFIIDNPEFKSHKAEIVKWAVHPAYEKVPVNQIARMIAFDASKKLGAEEERQTEKQVTDTKMGGTTNSASMAKKDQKLEDMSDDDILADIIPN